MVDDYKRTAAELIEAQKELVALRFTERNSIKVKDIPS